MTRQFRAYIKRLFGGFPAVFWWLWFSTFVNWVGRFVVPFMAIYLTQHLGFSAAQTGIMLSIFGVGGVIAAFAGGVLADLIGRRRTIVASHMLSAGTVLLFTIIHDPILMSALLLVLGVVNGSAEPATKALIADLLPTKDLMRGYAANMWALNLGYTLGPLLGSILVEYSYTLIFFANALVTAITAIIIFTRIPSDAEKIRQRRSSGVREATLSDVFKDRVFMGFVGLSLLFALIYTQCTISLPMIMADQGFSPSSYGLLLSVNGLIMIVLQMPLSDWVARFSRSIVLAISGLVVGIGFGSHMFADVIWIYVAGVLIWTIAEVINMPVATTVAADLAPKEARGRYMGVFTGTWGVASMIAPLAAGYTIEHFGSQALWGGCFILGVLCLIGRILIAPAQDKRLRDVRVAETRAVSANP